MLLEARDEVALADFEHVIVGLRALERHVVDRAGEVDLHEVALDDRAALDRLEAGEALLEHGELGFDLSVGDLDGVLYHLSPV